VGGPPPIADVPTFVPPPPDLTGTGLTDPGPVAVDLNGRPAPPPVSPAVAHVKRETAEVEALGEQLVEQREALALLSATAATTERAWSDASDRYRAARDRIDEWARQAYVLMARTGSPLAAPRPRPAPGPPPGRETLVGTVDGRDLGSVTETSARELATSTEAYARSYLARAGLVAGIGRLDAEVRRRQAALAALQEAHRAELEAARLGTDAYNDALSRRYLSSVGVIGGKPAPAALGAVRYALAQLGKPYVWAAEGPDSFDCSGLVQSAYAFAGVSVPRTARPQFLATARVPVNAMVAGDLLFFGPDPKNWNSIHHVGIYLGNGKMVHAPTTGDVVRVAPVWWAEFFGATRVVGAVTPGATVAPRTVPPPAPGARPGAAPGTSPSASPTPSRSPSPSPTPAPSPSPGPVGPTVPAPTTTPTPTPVPTPTPTPSPSCPTPDPSATPDPGPTPGATPTGPPEPHCPSSPEPSPTLSTSPTSTGVTTP
jgi:cell wall-associated NlpC family hydrolase